ncbi:alpha/beta fold hydrolase [Sphingomonas sp.]|uniref:alpha/beta fold hydrolase n=1 Tax=Sphingomonas sp. TaxID=28214 RepID=UPI002FC84F20
MSSQAAIAVPEVVQVAGVGLEVKAWQGTGTPILLLHEGLGSVAMWRDFPAALARRTGKPVIAWSRTGYGQSDPLPEPRDPDYMHREADLVPQVMDALGIARAILLGHSDGGSIALIAAARYPQRVAALILEAPHVFVEDVAVASIAAARDHYLASDMGERMARYHRLPDQVFWRWNDIWLDPRFRAWNIEDLLPRVAAPVLLIQGLDDEYGTLEQLDRIEAALPATARLIVPECGHSPHRDQPEAVLEAVAAFVRELQ